MKNSYLREIYLSGKFFFNIKENDFSDEGCIEVNKILKNSKIQKIELKSNILKIKIDNNITKIGLEHLSESLMNNEYLIKINLQCKIPIKIKSQ
jgi:Leucine-rich repeat (LRR) protein